MQALQEAARWIQRPAAGTERDRERQRETERDKETERDTERHWDGQNEVLIPPKTEPKTAKQRSFRVKTHARVGCSVGFLHSFIFPFNQQKLACCGGFKSGEEGNVSLQSESRCGWFFLCVDTLRFGSPKIAFALFGNRAEAANQQGFK